MTRHARRRQGARSFLCAEVGLEYLAADEGIWTVRVGETGQFTVSTSSMRNTVARHDHEAPTIPRFQALPATSPRYRLMIEGMIHITPHDTSPQDKPRDQETKEAVLATFPPSWRAAISMAGVSGGSTCYIELRPPISEEAALAIGQAFEHAFPGREVILNGLGLAEAPGALGMPWTPHTWPQHLRPPSCRDR